MPKQEHVPETKQTEAKPNRRRRRHPEETGSQDVPRIAEVHDEPLTRDETSSGQRKRTADKWNQ